jgi:hypothetical protein
MRPTINMTSQVRNDEQNRLLKGPQLHGLRLTQQVDVELAEDKHVETETERIGNRRERE